ncbi:MULTISPECIES: hypothetical protein [unclassified Mycobacterium]|uniref:hypothetical protein n=1 Tax=unclassified Mycobacterium TaxID=2642494 RepID=UPI0029C61981|nr:MULTISPECIES: hypothetical protein [unclassified Mycobacterium]
MNTLADLVVNLFSWQTAVGFIAGLLAQRAWVHWRAHRLDLIEPLPGGRRHRSGSLSRVWVAGAIVAFVLALVMVQTQRTANRTDQVIRDVQTLTRDTAECSRQFNAALKARSEATKFDGPLASLDARERALDARDRDASREWLFTLLNPPPVIADLSDGDPAREGFAVAITRQYLGAIEDVRKQRDDVTRQRDDLTRQRDAIRTANPYPDPTCGK